jgi:dipeptidyl aminopeptidase/acylaminoacyl peptidase
LLINASPLFAADKIRIPILNGQGATYAPAQQPESEQIADAIQKNSGNATYLLYPDEGHDLK